MLTLDHLRQGIGLRAYAQRDPLNEYKREAFDLFGEMLENLRERVTQVLAHVELQFSEPGQEIFRRPAQKMQESRSDPAFNKSVDMKDGDGERIASVPLHRRKAAADIDPDDPSTWGRVSRNAPCPCGSGNKYKRCHGEVV